MSCSTGPLANSAEFLSNDPISALLGWSLHKNGRRHDGGLNSLRARLHGVGDPGPVGFGFFCFHALGDTKQKKPTPLDRGPPLHVNRVLTLASFFHGSSNQALWNIHTAVWPSGIDTEWEFLPPLTQLITKCKRRTKITRMIKRSKKKSLLLPQLGCHRSSRSRRLVTWKQIPVLITQT